MPSSLNFVSMEVDLDKFSMISFFIWFHHLCHGLPFLSLSFYFSPSVFVTSSYNWNSFHPAQCSQLITQTGSSTIILINTHAKGLRRTVFKNMRDKKTRMGPCLKKTIKKSCSKRTKFIGPTFCDLEFYPSKEYGTPFLTPRRTQPKSYPLRTKECFPRY
jgi:hypothetical protein